MKEKYFLVTNKSIVKAKNMTHAKALISGDETVPGTIMTDNITSREVDESNASSYFSTISEEDTRKQKTCQTSR